MPATTRIETETTWQDLMPLAGGEGDGRDLLEALLELWCRERGAADAAVYLDDEAATAPQVAWGEGPFPRHAVERAGEASGFERLPLAGGVLLWRPGSGAAAAQDSPRAPGAGPTDLLLSLALANCRLHQRIKRQSFQASYRGVEIEALYDVGLAIASTLDLDALAEEILLRAVSLLDARRGALYLLAGEEYRLKSRFGGDARESFPASEVDGAPPSEVLPGSEHLELAPIAIEDDRRGLLAVADKESRTGVGPFSGEDRRTLALFANQAAIALENARLHREALEKERYERDLQLAAEIQRQILPKGVPNVTGYDLVGWNRPAREVGGDYYDLVSLPADEEQIHDSVQRLGIVLGDVSGKGVPAALMVSTLHSAIRLLMGRIGVGPRLVERLNSHVLASSAPNKFITLLLGELDTAAGELVYVNAGHNSGLLIRADGRLERLESSGLPVGLLPGSTYRAARVSLHPGDLLCLYSDGITESESPTDEEFGEDRLIELLRGVAHEPVRTILQAVDRAVTAFTAGQPQGDDQTLVLLRRE